MSNILNKLIIFIHKILCINKIYFDNFFNINHFNIINIKINQTCLIYINHFDFISIKIKPNMFKIYNNVGNLRKNKYKILKKINNILNNKN